VVKDARLCNVLAEACVVATDKTPIGRDLCMRTSCVASNEF